MTALHVVYVRRLVSQTDGATPLYIASQNGHVNCVWILLGWDAAINHARVGFACSLKL
jgi:hypothetical protein